MITAILLCHPFSADIVGKAAFRSRRVKPIRIACGTSKMKNVDLSESGDFFPTYASWNSAVFETSVILTVWEHADAIIGDNHVAIMHTDITAHFKPGETWRRIHTHLDDGNVVGLVAPSRFDGVWDDWLIPDDAKCTPATDPFNLHQFDDGISVWDFIKKYDRDLYDWAMDIQPRIIYSHQFAATRSLFDRVCDKLCRVARNLKLMDIGFWTPHMFERVLGLTLVRYAEPVLTTAFWHYASSGIHGPGEQSLYGPRPLRYYKTASRYNIRDNSA